MKILNLNMTKKASLVAQKVKNLRAMQAPRLDPWGRSPGCRQGNPTPVFLPGEFHGQRSLVGYRPWSCKVWHNWATNKGTENMEITNTVKWYCQDVTGSQEMATEHFLELASFEIEMLKRTNRVPKDKALYQNQGSMSPCRYSLAALTLCCPLMFQHTLVLLFTLS